MADFNLDSLRSEPLHKPHPGYKLGQLELIKFAGTLDRPGLGIINHSTGVVVCPDYREFHTISWALTRDCEGGN